MAKRSFYKVVFPALGGLNTAVHPTIINEQQLVQADNIVLVNDGSRKTRFGQSRFNSSALNSGGDLTMIADFFKSDGTQKTVVKAGTKYFADSAANGTFSDITGGASISATSKTTYAVMNNVLIICSDGEAPYKYSQSGNIALLGGSPPSGKYCRVHYGRFWIAGVSGNEHKLYFSQAFDPEEWSTGAGWLEIDPDDGSKGGITAIFPSFQGEMIVAKIDKLYKISGSTPSTFRVSPITTSIGCVSHNGIAAVQDDIIFHSERGITSVKTAENVKGDVQSTFLSAPIHNLYQKINKARYENMSGVFVPSLNSYIFSCSIDSATLNNRVFGYNIIINEWFEWTNYTSQTLSMIRDSSNRLRLMNGDDTGFVNRYNEFEQSPYSDFGSEAINFKIKTGAIYIQNKPHESWSYKGLWVTAASTEDATITVAYKIDNLEEQTKTLTLDVEGALLGTMVLGTDLLGGKQTLLPYYVPLDGIGHSIQLTMSISSTTVNIQIFGYDIEIKGGSNSYEVRA